MTDVVAQDEPDSKAEAAPQGPKGGVTHVAEIPFNPDLTILPGMPLQKYDKGAVKAFAVRHENEQGAGPFFAMICEDHLTPRLLQAPSYAAVLNPSLARLVASGPVEWAPAGKERYCFIFEDKLGNPLKKDDTRGGLGMKQEAVLTQVVRPLVSVLKDLRDKDVVHGCIRLSNIYDGGTRTLERAMLGEGLSVPHSAHMPVLYETTQRGMATPTGRGPGNFSDDLYAFGVCLAILLRNTDPLEGMTDDQILEVKMEEGSYSALTGRDRFTGAILELLRGLLHDDEVQRWTLNEVIEWLDGRRLSPKQSDHRPKSNRPLLFNGQKYYRPELLAKDLHKNHNEAKQLIENGELEQWIVRALEDKAMNANLERMLRVSSEDKGAGYAERLITRVVMVLYPEGPIRYKNLSIMPGGIGTALTEAYVLKRDVQTYVDFLMAYFISQWVDLQVMQVADVGGLVSKYDGARAFLRMRTVGGGIERCIYSLNPQVHCLSDKISRYYVRMPEDLLQAFEKVSHRTGRPAQFFDRHIIAFLAAKERKSIEPFLSDFNAAESYRRAMGEMKVLAMIQKRSQLEPVPGVAAWVIENMGPIYERFHDRTLRAETAKKVEKLKEGGNLVKILNFFDNPLIYQEDNVGFRRAMRKYYDLDTESARLEKDLRDEGKYGAVIGRQIAAAVSGALAALIILMTAFSAFGSGGGSF